MNRKIKLIGIFIIAAICYYGLQYASTAVHYNCYILKDDCVPPINLASEFVYRVMVQPPWLNKFEISPMTYSFEDGRFNFWEGEVNGKTVVIRVREGDSPVMQWIKELPLGVPIYPADGEHIKQWLESHPEYKLSQ